MRAEQPEVTRFGDRHGRRRGDGIGRVVVGRDIEALNAEVDLAHVEADRLKAEVQVQGREILQALREELIVPAGVLGQAVVGDHVRPSLGRAQVFEADRRHLGPAEQATGFEAAVAGDELAVAVDQDRHVEAEGLDAAGDLLNLALGVSTRVARIGVDGLDRQHGHGGADRRGLGQR